MPRLLLLMLVATSCHREDLPKNGTGSGDSGAGGADTCGDWSAVGQPLMLTYCTGCHSTALEGKARHGAPSGVDLETLAGVQALAARVRVRAVEQQDMPQGGGLSEADRARLAAWLDCGAPGEAAALPALPGAEAEGLVADDLSVTVSQVGIAERQVVHTRSDGRVLLEERFLVDGSGVALFSGYDLRLESGGRAMWFDRPIPLSPQDADADTWTAEVLAEVDAGVYEAQSWTLTRWTGADVAVDGRSEDRAPVLVEAVEATSGEQHRWLISETHVLSGRSLAAPGVRLEMLRLDQYVPNQPDEITPFPPEDGDEWSESAVWGGEGSPWWE